MTEQTNQGPEELVVPLPGSVLKQEPTAAPTEFDPEAFSQFAGNNVEELPVVQPERGFTPVTQSVDEPLYQLNAAAGSLEKPTVTQEYPTFSKLKNAFDKNAISLALPADTISAVDEAMQKYPESDPTKEVVEWAKTLQSGLHIATHGDRLKRSTVRSGSDWRQSVPSEAGPLTAFKPGGLGSYTGQALTGHRAMLRVREVTSGGSGLIKIPLWSSGFWVTLKTPSESALLDLDRQIQETKINLGRRTYGGSMSNVSVYVVEHVWDLISQHLYDTSLQNQEDLEKLISIQDIQTLGWALALAVWPRGFQYTRSIVTPDKPDYRIVKELLNIGKVHWTDVSALTKWQITHMSRNTSASMTLDSVKKYRDEFTVGVNRVVPVYGGLSVMLKVPTLAEYLENGHAWVDEIVLMTDRAFQMNDNENARNEYITNQGRATRLRQYGHWVKKIVYDNGDEVVDQESIDLTLSELSVSDEATKEFLDAVTQYMDDTAISVVAVPTVTEEEENVFPRWPHLVPIDSVTTFFILLGQKIQLIVTRT